MSIFVVLALMASAMASPYAEKQDKDSTADLVYNGALQSLHNTQIDNADPSADENTMQQVYAEEQAGEDTPKQEYAEEALEDTLQQEYNNNYAEKLDAPSEAPRAHEQGRASGFRKVYSLDMTNSRQRCPSNFRLNTYGSMRLCGRARTGCVSIPVRVRGKSYNQVRGRVIGYQYSSPDAFHSGSSSIDGVYVDGVSITHGRNPRKHVWTLGAGLFSYSKSSVTCPGTGYGRPQPAFVGNNYFCTSGNFGTGWQRSLYHVPLWSTVTGNCAHCNGRYDVPYFCTQLTKPTTDDLEIRVCGNQDTNDEDIKIESIELYIK